MYIWGVLYVIMTALVIAGSVISMSKIKNLLRKRRAMHYAYHEAGHVVMFLALGCPFDTVHLAEDGTGGHGQVTPRDDSFSEFPFLANENVIKIAYAGVIASSLRYMGDHRDEGYSDNLVIAETLKTVSVPIGHLSMEDYLRSLRLSVRAALSSNAPALEAIASFLVKRKNVTQSDILEHLKWLNISIVS
jgi:hypothetical protein